LAVVKVTERSGPVQAVLCIHRYFLVVGVVRGKVRSKDDC
jgi:hypothetical protein